MVALTAPRSLVAATHAAEAALVVIDAAGHRLAPDAAASYTRMRAAGLPAGVTSAYRSAADQSAQAAREAAGLTPSAAAVGTSWHEAGRALDLPVPARSWPGLAEHGWVRTLRAEPWHHVYDPSIDQHARATSAGSTTSTEDEDMALTDEDVQRIAQATAASVWHAPVYDSADSAEAYQRLLAASRAATATWQVPVYGDPADQRPAYAWLLAAAATGAVTGAGQIDTAALAAQLREALGAAVAADLARRLAS